MENVFIFIVAIVILYILNMFFISIYCRLQKILEKKYTNSKTTRKTINRENEGSKQKKIVVILKNVYKYAEHYLYGWMRLWQLKVSRYPSNRIRKFLYKYIFCMNITKKTVISGGCEIRSPWNVYLGNCIIAGNCILDGRSKIIIKDNVVLGMGVHIWTQEHDVNSPSFAVTDEHRGRVEISERAWICSDSTILPGVKVGEGAVIASKALVSKDCESFKIYGGVPAKPIGDREKKLEYVLSGKPHWHFY